MLAVLAAVAVLAGGCRLDLTVDVRLVEGGGANLAVLADLDAALLDELDRLGVDPTAELEAAAAGGDWALGRRARDDGGVTVILSRDLAEAAAVGPALRELAAGLDEVDPALVVDLEVDVDDDGGANLAGTAELRPPSSAGVRLDGRAVGPDAGALAALTAEVVGAQLRVTVPGQVLDQQGGRLEGQAAVWDLPVGMAVDVGLRSAAPAWWQRTSVRWAAAGAGALLTIVAVGAVVARRRQRASVTNEG